MSCLWRTDGRTNARKVESRAVFSLSWIRKNISRLKMSMKALGRNKENKLFQFYQARIVQKWWMIKSKLLLQARHAGLRQVPAGQRHVHHRPVGQAGQQQGRQQSRWVIFVSFIVLSLSKISFRRRENTRTTDHPKNYQQSEMRKNWSRKKKNKSISLKYLS